MAETLEQLGQRIVDLDIAREQLRSLSALASRGQHGGGRAEQDAITAAEAELQRQLWLYRGKVLHPFTGQAL